MNESIPESIPEQPHDLASLRGSRLPGRRQVAGAESATAEGQKENLDQSPTPDAFFRPSKGRVIPGSESSKN